MSNARRSAMGGTKKSGRGGGGGGKDRQRYSDPATRVKVSNQGSVPSAELRRVGLRLMAQSTGATKHQTFGRVPVNQEQLVKRRITHARSTPSDVSAAPAEDGTLEDDEDAVADPRAEELAARGRVSEMAAYALNATRKQQAHVAPLMLLGEENTHGDSYTSENHSRQNEHSLKRFFNEFRKVVDSSDVLLEVLDARDPMGCRLLQMERTIESQWGDRKTIVIVLNKIDLIPVEVTKQWVDFFRKEGKTVVGFTAVRETTRSARGTPLRNSCIAELFRVLRQLARGESAATRKSITVGVIGYPNVGKSSVINALKRRNVVGVGNTPGFTTGNTEVDLRSDIKIIDCPGVVMPGEDSGDVVLRNAVKVDQLPNPVAAVARLLSRCDPTALARVYSIGETFASVDEFVRSVGLRRGRVRHGSEVNEDETARMVLHDWNDGRIGYFTLPPASDGLTLNFGARDDAGPDAMAGDTKVFSSLSASVLVDGLPTFHVTNVEPIGHRKRVRAERAEQPHGQPRRRTEQSFRQRPVDVEESSGDSYDSEDEDEDDDGDEEM